MISSIPTFEVVRPGLLTTIQDLGRAGYQKFGFAISGAADPYAHRIANILVGNSESAATLEMTLVGPRLRVLRSTVIAITGADLNPTVNGHHISTWSTTVLGPGDVLDFRGSRSGCRAYLAVAGGIDVPIVLGSRSTDLLAGIGGMSGRKLEQGDVVSAFVPTVEGDRLVRRRLHSDWIPSYGKQEEVRVLLGPQDDAFSEDEIERFLSLEYTVSNTSDRMGLRLTGPALRHKGGADILSEGMFVGAVQVPPDGQPIVFLSGLRSVGGYTKIAGVITVDVPTLAQLKPGDRLSFTKVTIQEAHQLLLNCERFFAILKTCGDGYVSA